MNVEEQSSSEEILESLAQRPDAQDTLEGITKWWLLEHYIEKNAKEVRSALEDLARTRLLLAVERPGCEVSYRLLPHQPRTSSGGQETPPEPRNLRSNP